LRATDDIPAGTFVCTYAGYILNEELANQDGRKYGDEYMAELDYIGENYYIITTVKHAI
jgi:hypothetical protein